MEGQVVKHCSKQQQKCLSSKETIKRYSNKYTKNNTNKPINHHTSIKPTNTQPSDQPFNTQPSDQPFNTQPSDQPFNTQPSDQPFNTQPSDQPFNTQPSDQPFNTQPTDTQTAIGISTNPCEQTFAGPKAFWDPEGKAVADFILSKESQWDVFLTIHSYGHLLLAPWGYTQELPENYPDLVCVWEVWCAGCVWGFMCVRFYVWFSCVLEGIFVWMYISVFVWGYDFV